MNRFSLLSTLALAAGLLAACAGPQTRYYSLAEPVAAAAAPAGPPLFIELAPLALPERLARPQMVLRRAGSPEVEVLEYSRWSSSFENELRDALAGAVASRLGAVNVSARAAPPGRVVWRFAAQVNRFDLSEGRGADAELSWTVRGGGDSRAVTCLWTGREGAGAAGTQALAAAAQRLTAQAASAMAGSVSALASGAPVPGCQAAY